MRRNPKAIDRLIILLLFIVPVINLPAQDFSQHPKSRFTDKLFYGGGLGLQFGSITLIDISPVIGYRITEKFETGLGFTYKYYRVKDYFVDPYTNTGYDLKSNIVGGSIFTRYHILENVFAHIEFETLNYTYEDLYNSPGGTIQSVSRSALFTSFFVGGGYRQRISSGSYFFIMALWNLNDSALSPYTNPVLRMGVIFGK